MRRPLDATTLTADMGIYDRDYLKDEVPLYRRLGRSTLVGIMGSCVFAWLLQLMTHDPRQWGPGAVTEFLACTPGQLFGGGFPQLWRPFTALFAHAIGGIAHIFWNLFFLWVFGREVEREFGGGEFLRFFLIAGALSVVGECISLEFMGRENTMVLGASGAVMGVMAVYVGLAPTAPFQLLFVTLPRWAIGLFFVILDMRDAVDFAGNGVANLAHLVGAFYGFLFIVLDLRWERLFAKKKARRPRRPREKPARARSEEPPPALRGDETSERIDALLAKISVLGMEGLSEEERSFLQENSKNYRSPRSS